MTTKDDTTKRIHGKRGPGRPEGAKSKPNPKPALLLDAEFIEARRLELRMSQTELAERAHMLQSQVSNLESGKVGVPNGGTLYWLAKALRAPMERFVIEQGAPAEGADDTEA